MHADLVGPASVTAPIQVIELYAHTHRLTSVQVAFVCVDM